MYLAIARFFLLSTLSINSIFAVDAAEGIAMSASGAACISTRLNAAHAHEETEWRCSGPAGYSLIYRDFVTQAGVTLSRRGKELDSKDLTWAPANAGIGSRIEWRVENGEPVAAILGRWRTWNEIDTYKSPVVEELVVLKITPTIACRIATIGSFSSQSMMVARHHAETRARNFRCGVDHQFINTSEITDAITVLNGRLIPNELFNHNGSVVELRKSRSGAIEIAYQTPKPGLNIDPGATLFQGTQRDGLIVGTAFTFKHGCMPAGYKVSGRREGAYLYLEGSAPKRGAGCAIIGNSGNSQHSRLAFERDPVLNVVATTAIQSALPIVRGYYVRADTSCGQASNASIMLFNGKSFGSAHQECKNPITLQLVDRSYKISESCRTTQVENASWDTSTTNVEVRSSTAFVSTTPFQKTAYRYCKQPDLPDPWSTVDLGEIAKSAMVKDIDAPSASIR